MSAPSQPIVRVKEIVQISVERMDLRVANRLSPAPALRPPAGRVGRERIPSPSRRGTE